MRLQFPPPPGLLARRLPLAEFCEQFEQAWADLRSEYVRLERRQSYQQAGDPSWEAFLAGDWAACQRLIAEAHRWDGQLYEEGRRRGVAFVRLRVVERPLSPYLRWEFEHYRHCARAGERIFVVEQPSVAAMDAALNLSDFALFDRRLALVHEYGPGGALEGGWLLTDPQLVGELAVVADLLLRVAAPFEAALAR